ncbi:MAG: hypothetical protein A3H96_20725 [Acidobacteria bacterium RIFCSPLOWO2_02_FULL_67_36]|nr:MAG: hypothetical protein A3H96_20725 [Acidobacteria bacterium RIFCSPLOWO2_02_FULL_67_36]OFW25479.1 MAG: hypothetical protein A3G21_19530 [Acidobacteria bacterium RIFCSPLOWO2_12_FULL_66_21]
MFTSKWDQHRKSYDFVVVGSGYGGAITAARIAAATPGGRKSSVCILERGRERWAPNHRFPDTLREVSGEFRSDLNPDGLYELLTYHDISVLKGCGLGGTSLINANVAATPDEELFAQADWPRRLSWNYLRPYYDRARKALGAGPDPRAWQFPKVQAMDRRARELGTVAVPLDLAINFTGSGVNEHGVPHAPCVACGDCTSGCNHLAKGALYMNYLPMARNAGAQIFTKTTVDRLEKLPHGGWRVYGNNRDESLIGERFTLETANVILGAGSINSTELLLRSESRELSFSPALGTRFSSNGDFFGLAFNGDFRTVISGIGNRYNEETVKHAPGPAIVSAIHYNGTGPLAERFQIEDLTIPSAYVAAAQRVFPSLQREDSDTGDEAEEQRRINLDLRAGDTHDLDGALNHTMLYLIMGQDDARGRMVLDSSWPHPGGRVRVVWDDAGRQRLYTMMHEELRRHARTLGASYIANPMWSFLEIRHLLTAHPIGGCPVGEDYEHGAVDEFGRVFSGDGSVHDGLFVADGAILPRSLGVNPFLTISAMAEQIAERKVRELAGEPYPARPTQVVVPSIDPLEIVGMEEAELERLFRSRPTADIAAIVNSGRHAIDVARGIIENDTGWRGFFPKGHVLNAMSAALFTGFRKQFRSEGGNYLGVTSDTDGRIHARDTLEEVTIEKGIGTLEPGRYLLLRYVDPPWRGFYDLLKIVDRDVVIGRVYLGAYPSGVRLFTFAMTRKYRLTEMTVAEHVELFEGGTVPSPETLAGAWRMDVISNANQLRALATLAFELKPDGRLESRYQIGGLLEGLVTPRFLQDHFELRDFTPFHDEIRTLSADALIGKYVAELPDGVAPIPGSLGLLHAEGNHRFGCYYVLTRSDDRRLPANTILRPFLDMHLPDGLGMTFDEEMDGWYLPGADDAPESRPAGAVDCSFRLRMTVRDLNEFIEAPAHEARAKGRIRFADLDGRGPTTHAVDEQRSWFRYLTIDLGRGEAEMQYCLEFATDQGARFALDGRKHMRKDRPAGPRAAEEVLEDYTTLFGRVFKVEETERRQVGAARLKFRTFENLVAARNLVAFLQSFQVTGTDDPLLRTHGLLRFMAFTAQFVQYEYDPLAPMQPA